jgi:hypothetical protein
VSDAILEPQPDPEPTPTEAAPEPVVEPAAEAVPVVPAPVRDPTTGKFVAPPKWASERIGELTGKNKDLLREKEEVARENALLKTQLELLHKATPGVEPTSPPPPPAPTLTKESLKAEIHAELAFQHAAAEVMEQGKKEFPDFEASLTNFQHLGPVDPVSIAAAFETGKGHVVLHTLSQDLDLARKIFSLPPTKMAIEMERIAQANTKKAPEVSKAPPPISPITGRGSASEELKDELSTAEWMKLREQQVIARRRRA